MPEVTMSQTPLVIGAEGIEAIRQNIRLIVLTAAYSVPLDRSFAGTHGFVDAPSPVVAARLIAELTDIIEAREPRVIVRSITLERTTGTEAMQGVLAPRIIFDVKDGAL